MTSIVAIVGPTGSGKTELSLGMAHQLDAEIVNFDSRQIYRGLDIGTAKPSAAIRAEVPHHLFDVVEPDEAFDCSRYHELARVVIEEIRARGRSVVLVGGTGLYLKALRYGLFPGPARDERLREDLYARDAAARGCLHRQLARIDALAAARLHPNDLVRVVRAIEVYELTGVTISDWHARHEFRGNQLDVNVVGLEMPREQLYQRLDARCAAMVGEGLVGEVRGLLESGYAADLASLRSIGYREIVEYLREGVPLERAVDKMRRATRRFAKRQMTWFRADETIAWFDARRTDSARILESLVAATGAPS